MPTPKWIRLRHDRPANMMNCLKASLSKSALVTKLLTVFGFALATGAAFFPWYVFFNQESFGIAPMGYSETRDLPETGGRSFVNVSPLAIRMKRTEAPNPPPSIRSPPLPFPLATRGTADRLRRLLTPTGRFPASRSTSCCMSPMAARLSRTSRACTSCASVRCCRTIPVLPLLRSATASG
jgi:hypothetical protein